MIMQASVQAIGPERARQMLERNSGNRTLNKNIIARYRTDMLRGRWRPNGSSISLGPGGRLLNGQHRLSALIEADTTVEFVIVEEDTDEVFSTLDIGVNRSTATLLHQSGIANGAVVGAISRQVLAYQSAPAVVWDTMTAGGRSAVIEWAIANNDMLLQSCCHVVTDVRKQIPTIGSWYGTLAYLVATRSESNTRWLDFHLGVLTGANLPEGDPRLALRNWIINRPAPHSEWDRQMSLGVGITAWNRYATAGTAQFFKFTRASLPMPEIV